MEKQIKGGGKTLGRLQLGMRVREGLPGKMRSEQKRAGGELRGDQGRVVAAGGM